MCAKCLSPTPCGSQACCLRPQASTLVDYKMKLPISHATTWRWMQAVNIFRDKYKQSYYNDKHQDPTVIEERQKYIKVMDTLSLRQPLWLQLSMHEFWAIKERMPEDALLVHHYQVDGAQMVEVHVDLDDAFDARRAALPLGGHFSVRFPGRPPADTVFRHRPVEGLPAPGTGLTPTSPFGTQQTEETPAATNAAAGHASASAAMPQLPTLTAISKMKVIELKAQLNALGLDMCGKRNDLVSRLRTAVTEVAERNAPVQETEESSEEEEWKVKKIIGRRVVTHVVEDVSFDVVEFQVQWDYPDENDTNRDEVTWESESNLTNTIEALHEFFASQPKQPGCSFGHIVGVCRCALPLIHTGQDESIFKAFQKSSYQWVVQNIRGLRKKTDGPGEMVSGFKDELRGFGHPLTQEELGLLNAFRQARGREPLTSSPAVRFLSYGKNKDGYWTYEHFSSQVVDILDMYECLYPTAQVLIEVDWSSGHSKHRADALNVAAMGVTLGGKQAIPHPSKMVEGCLRDGAMLKEGDMQYFYFRSAEERRDAGHTDGMPDAPPFYKPDMPAADYVGLAKGKKQILFERGMWKAGMVEQVDDDDPKGRDQSMSIDYVLSSCPDFRNETSALQTLVESRGHILIMSPKGHCELAGAYLPFCPVFACLCDRKIQTFVTGNGIEYDWGRMKQNFRRKNRYINFHELILSSMAPQSLPLSTSRKFARKARAYRRAYRHGVDNEYACIEKMVKRFKAHRNAADFAKSFIKSA